MPGFDSSHGSLWLMLCLCAVSLADDYKASAALWDGLKGKDPLRSRQGGSWVFWLWDRGMGSTGNARHGGVFREACLFSHDGYRTDSIQQPEGLETSHVM